MSAYQNVTQTIAVPVSVCGICSERSVPKVRRAEFQTFYPTEGADLISTATEVPEGWDYVSVPGAFCGLACPECLAHLRAVANGKISRLKRALVEPAV